MIWWCHLCLKLSSCLSVCLSICMYVYIYVYTCNIKWMEVAESHLVSLIRLWCISNIHIPICVQPHVIGEYIYIRACPHEKYICLTETLQYPCVICICTNWNSELVISNSQIVVYIHVKKDILMSLDCNSAINESQDSLTCISWNK